MVARQTRNRVRSILSVCEELGYRSLTQQTLLKNNFNFLSEVVRCGASQKKHRWDSTKRTARRCLLLEMCRRLRLITRNYLVNARHNISFNCVIFILATEEINIDSIPAGRCAFIWSISSSSSISHLVIARSRSLSKSSGLY